MQREQVGPKRQAGLGRSSDQLATRRSPGASGRVTGEEGADTGHLRTLLRTVTLDW